MKINKGVEWAVHAMSVLAVLPEGRAVSAEALAAYHETSATYMAKQLQALSKAGLVRGGRGADLFQFGLGDGHDVIDGFGPGDRVVIDLDRAPSDLAGLLMQTGRDVTLTLGPGLSITWIDETAEAVARAIDFV